MIYITICPFINLFIVVYKKDSFLHKIADINRFKKQYELLVLLMHLYDILSPCQNRPKQNAQAVNQDFQLKLYQNLVQRNVDNQNLINQYLKSIAKKERKISKMSAQDKFLIFSPIRKTSPTQQINGGICYSSQDQIIAPKQNQQKKKQNHEAKFTSILRHTRQYKKMRNLPNTRSFLQPIQPTHLPCLFSIVTPTQLLPIQKPLERKETAANQLRKLLLKQVYSLHQHISKPIDFQFESQNENLKQFSQNYWIQKHLNIKKIGLQASKNVRKIKTEPLEPGRSSEIKHINHSLRGFECKQRPQQTDKSLPKVNGTSHLQRNKRCLEMFLKFSSHKKKQNSSIIRSCKTQTEDLISLKRLKTNTLPLKKQN